MTLAFVVHPIVVRSVEPESAEYRVPRLSLDFFSRSEFESGFYFLHFILTNVVFSQLVVLNTVKLSGGDVDIVPFSHFILDVITCFG